MTDTPCPPLRDLNTLRTDAAQVRDLQAQFLTWLETPEHQARQITGVLFGRKDQCCALGALALVLQSAGFAAVDPAHPQVRVQYQGRTLSRWPTGLPDIVGHILGWELGWISHLNDEGRHSFAQIARRLRQHDVDQNTLPF